jgi:putative cofactor-binding repeat protein
VPLPIQREIEKAMVRGFEFVEFNYFNYLVPYQGSLDDGRWWDTILMSWALLEASETSSVGGNTIDYK